LNPIQPTRMSVTRSYKSSQVIRSNPRASARERFEKKLSPDCVSMVGNDQHGDPYFL